MTTGRKPRKPMMPALSDSDRAVIETTAKHSGLTTSQPGETAKPGSAVARTTPQAPRKALRVSVAPSSDLASAVHDKLRTLSPDAQKFASTATLLREFLNEHDAQLAQLFREYSGI